MENNQLLPFERNRYYMGKLLTSADFLAEQAYHNNKRRFVNSLMFGSGVVCGLSVYNLDDHSIMVESGVAVDAMGREIVLENSEVKKLSAIEGFEEAQSGCLALCVAYREEAVHPVYSISQGDADGEGYELNRIRESCKLFLTDAEALPSALLPETEFFSSAVLYADEDYSVTLSTPAVACCGSKVKVVVNVEKLSALNKAFSMSCALQTPAFTDGEGSHELAVKVQNIFLQEGEKHCQEYWMAVQAQAVSESLIVAKANFADIEIDGEKKRLADNFLLKVAVADTPVQDVVQREIGRISLESRSLLELSDSIPLALLTLQRTKNNYIIEKVDEEIKSYIRTTAADALFREYSSWYGRQDGIPLRAPAEYPIPQGGGLTQEPLYASGICEIPLGPNMRKGDVEYSSEIMHGLGKGNVYVDVGFEYIDDDLRLGEKAKSTIYGDAELFAPEELPISYAQTAVKVMNDRGSFVVAAKLLRETNYVILTLRWVAIKLPAAEDLTMVQKLSGKSIAAMQPTVVLAARESHYFGVTFKNMEPCPLVYRLTDENAGEITSDGIYTAPAKEGVYEIAISCEGMPLISTYAYAVVKRKDMDAPGEKQPD